MRITGILRRPGRRRVTVLVDGRPLLSLSPQVVAEAGLHPDDEISPERLTEIQAAQLRQDALAWALRLLAYRPRSQAELRQRLARRGVPDAVAEETLERLRSLGLVDDEAFARSWVEVRQQRSPRSRRLLGLELRAKGVEREVRSRVLAQTDDDDAAYRAALRRARSLAALPYPEFRRRLGDLLLRRGFSYETVQRTVRRLWEETHGESWPPGEE